MKHKGETIISCLAFRYLIALFALLLESELKVKMIRIRPHALPFVQGIDKGHVAW